MGIKIDVGVRESYTTYVVRDYITIDSDDREETKGMSKDELIEYIKENYQEEDSNLLNKDQKSNYNTLSEILFEQEPTREKITDQNVWLGFRDNETGEIEEHY